jgi:dihydroorotate dehydrogenase electron transfer subunit
MSSTKEMKPVATKILKIVEENQYVKSFYLSEIESKIITKNAKPGNFLMLWIPGPKDSKIQVNPHFDISDNIPMSISDCDNDILRITVRSSGKTTDELHKYSENDLVGIMGPFGRGFVLEGQNILLVGGGIGIAPLSFLAKTARKEKKNIYLIIGAKTKKELLLTKEMEKFCNEVYITTDDGTKGIKGFAPDIVEKICDLHHIDYIYSCGPEIMMKKILDISLKKNIPAQFSLERYMHCGIGICGFCSINDFYVCKDGPIFYSDELKDISDFGYRSRKPSGISKTFLSKNP